MASTVKREVILQGRIKGVFKQNTPIFVGPVETVGGKTENSDSDFGFIHAEGENVSSFAPNGTALGVNAVAAHENSFVWNGDSESETVTSNGDGSFTVVPSSKFFIGEFPISHYYQDFIELSGGNIRGNVSLGGSKFSVGLDCESNGVNSVAFGYDSKSDGSFSHSEGEQTRATGDKSHAEGLSSKSIGENSHVEGVNGTAIGKNSYLWTVSEQEFTQDGEGTFTLADSSVLYIGDDRFDTSYIDGFSNHATGEIQENLDDSTFVHTTGDEYRINGEKVFVGAFDAQNARNVYVKSGIGINNNNSQLASTEFVKNLFLSFMNKGYVSETESPVPSGVYSNNKKLLVYQNNVATEIQSSPEPTSGAFANCDRMVEFDGQNIDTIGDYAFYGAVEFKNLNIQSNVLYVGSHAFENCKSLDGTFEMQYAEQIGACAFSGCDGIDVLKFNSATTIGASAFSDCSSLLDIYFGQFTESELLGNSEFLSGWFGSLQYDYLVERYMVIHAKDRAFAYQRPSHIALDLNNEDHRGLSNRGTVEFSYLNGNDRYTKYYTNSSCSVNLNTNGTHIVKPNLGPAYTFRGYYTNAHDEVVDSNGNSVVSESNNPLYVVGAEDTQCIDANGRILDYVRTTLYGENVLHAKWTLNSYTVGLDFNGGSGGPQTVESILATYSFDLPPLNGEGELPNRRGYLFGGYFDSQDSRYYSEYGYGVKTWDKTSSSTLYAKWNPITHSLYYDYGSGTPGEFNPSVLTYDVWSKVSNPSRTGYTFAGWSLSGGDYAVAKYRKTIGGSVTESSILNSNMVCTVSGSTVDYLEFKNLNSNNLSSAKLNAKWNANTYTITFNSSAELYDVGTTEANAIYDSALPTNLTKPYRTGYVFQGYYDEDGTKYYDSSFRPVKAKYDVPSDIDVYSDWSLGKFNLKFNGDKCRFWYNNRWYTGLTVEKNYADTVTISATPLDFFDFGSWAKSNGSVLTYNPNYTFTCNDTVIDANSNTYTARAFARSQTNLLNNYYLYMDAASDDYYLFDMYQKMHEESATTPGTVLANSYFAEIDIVVDYMDDYDRYPLFSIQQTTTSNGSDYVCFERYYLKPNLEIIYCEYVESIDGSSGSQTIQSKLWYVDGKITEGKRTKIKIARTGTTAYLYIDGVSIGSQSLTTPTKKTTNPEFYVRIGALRSSDSASWWWIDPNIMYMKFGKYNAESTKYVEFIPYQRKYSSENDIYFTFQRHDPNLTFCSTQTAFLHNNPSTEKFWSWKYEYEE